MVQTDIEAVLRLNKKFLHEERKLKHAREKLKAPVSEAALSNIELEARLERMKSECDRLRIELRKEIMKRVWSPVAQEVLILKYVESRTLSAIAERLNYSDARTVSDFVKAGLKEWNVNQE